MIVPSSRVQFRTILAGFCIGLFVWLGMFAPVHRAGAATNISATTTEHWAWNDLIGWMNFYSTSNINVGTTQLTGYASSSAGDISLDCATTRIGNICGTSNYKVLNDGVGNLSGWAWNDTYGWISFCGSASTSTADCPLSVNYRVLIDPATGDFSQYAWNDILGWISFNCGDPGLCVTSNYKVKTSWVATSTSATLDSTTFDTGEANGAQFNYLMWQGSYPVGTLAQFQFATANASSGPWNFKGPAGTANDYYASAVPGQPMSIEYTLHNNQRYFRYRVTLTSNLAQTASPRIDDVIVGWSP